MIELSDELDIQPGHRSGNRRTATGSQHRQVPGHRRRDRLLQLRRHRRVPRRVHVVARIAPACLLFCRPNRLCRRPIQRGALSGAFCATRSLRPPAPPTRTALPGAGPCPQPGLPTHRRRLMLAAGGELKVVQATLGHDNIVLTADTYSSLLPCLAHQTAEATAALVLEAAHRTTRKIRGRSRTSRSRYRPRKRRTARPQSMARNTAA
jgi:hypothetical protein